MRSNSPASTLDEIFRDAGVDERLYTLRSDHPELAFEIDEVARAIARAQERIERLIVGSSATRADVRSIAPFSPVDD